ncbi:MAG TPA: molybdopterin-binding protein, partial [Casimicrobiaceae bacterium]
MRARIAIARSFASSNASTIVDPDNPQLVVGLVSISDRASQGVYVDQGLPGLREWFTAALASPWRFETRLIPDEQPQIERTLVELVDEVGCHLVLTTGGTGPAPRDVTPEATLAV